MKWIKGLNGIELVVCSISELNAFNMERTITIRGPMEAVARAEDMISGKLRQCWENDMMNAPQMMYGGSHPLMAPSMIGPPQVVDQYAGYPAAPMPGAAPFGPAAAAAAGIPAGPLNMGPPGAGPAGAGRGGQQPMTEVVHMWVPNNIVGALIGTKGVHIRNVMRLTGAHIRIEGGTGTGTGAGGKPEEAAAPPAAGAAAGNGGAAGDRRQPDERLVTITGTDAQQYKAQFWIYQRVCEQGYHFFDEVRLCTEVSVPTKLVGRIIGKGGQNVRSLPPPFEGRIDTVV